MTMAVNAAYLVSATLFILALRWMSSPETARRAVMSAIVAMGVAVGATLLRPDVVNYEWIAIAAMIQPLLTMKGWAQVARTAITMPATPACTPRRAVFGSLIQWSEKMKSAVATR